MTARAAQSVRRRGTPADFGRALARYARSGAAYRESGIDGTWREGGCWVMAAALAQWIGPTASLWAVLGHRAPPGDVVQPHHVVVRVGDLYFDGDGASTARELARRWRDEEDVVVDDLQPFTARWRDVAEEGQMVCPADQRSALAAALARRFGRPEQWGLAPLRRAATPNPARVAAGAPLVWGRTYETRGPEDVGALLQAAFATGARAPLPAYLAAVEAAAADPLRIWVHVDARVRPPAVMLQARDQAAVGAWSLVVPIGGARVAALRRAGWLPVGDPPVRVATMELPLRLAAAAQPNPARAPAAAARPFHAWVDPGGATWAAPAWPRAPRLFVGDLRVDDGELTGVAHRANREGEPEASSVVTLDPARGAVAFDDDMGALYVLSDRDKAVARAGLRALHAGLRAGTIPGEARLPLRVGLLFDLWGAAAQAAAGGAPPAPATPPPPEGAPPP